MAEVPPVTSLVGWSPADFLAQLDDHEARMRILEAAIYGVTVAPFSAPGTWEPTTFVVRYHVEHGYDIMQVRMSLGFAPEGGSAVGSVWINETDPPIATLTIPEGENTAVVDLAGTISMEAGDYLTVGIDESTGFEADWSWQVRMIRTE